MDTPSHPQTAGPPPSPMSLPQRIQSVFFAPRSVFESLDVSPRILGALLVLVVLNLVAGLLTSNVAMQAQMEHLQERPDADAHTVAVAAAVGRILFLVVSMLGPLIYVLILAGIFLFVTNVILGGSTNYRRMLAAEAHIGMVSIVMLVVRVPLVLMQQDIKVQTSLAAFLPRSSSTTFLYQGLAQFDVFALWMVGLTVVAVSVLGAIPTRKAATGVIGTWLVFAVAWTPVATLIERAGH